VLLWFVKLSNGHTGDGAALHSKSSIAAPGTVRFRGTAGGTGIPKNSIVTMREGARVAELCLRRESPLKADRFLRHRVKAARRNSGATLESQVRRPTDHPHSACAWPKEQKRFATSANDGDVSQPRHILECRKQLRRVAPGRSDLT
jgi:hypothetical protein